MAKKRIDDYLQRFHNMREFQKLFPHIFRKPSAEFHYAVNDFMDKNPERLAVAIARGFGKSTSFTFGQVMRRICYREEKVILVLASNEDLAKALISSVKYEINHNKRIQKLFNISIPPGWKNSAEEIHIKTGEGADDFIALKALGYGQNVRGINVRNWRPTLIILDDYTSTEKARTSELVRKQIEETIDYAVKYALDPEFGKLWVIGTIVHEEDVLQKMIEDPEVPSFFFPALDENDKSLWEEYHPTKKLLKERAKAMEKKSKYKAFLLEKMLQPTATDLTPFSSLELKFYDTNEWTKDFKRKMRTYISIDYAPSTSERGDYSVVSCVGLGEDGKRYVLAMDYIKENFLYSESGAVDKVSKIIESVFLFNAKFGARKVIVETRQGGNLIAEKIKIEMYNRKIWLEVIPITEKNLKVENKNERIMFYLYPLFLDGDILFPINKPAWFWKFYNDELVKFAPDKDNAHDDGLDTLVMSEHYIKQDQEEVKITQFGSLRDDYVSQEDLEIGNPYVF
ncbi:MAG: hypothetical protein DRG27_00610 [Deltaproteobacteria bacterium]|nr:MAG: hypothetical protein DRG27_00610 [Deltaproteobacteria bacterium]